MSTSRTLPTLDRPGVTGGRPAPRVPALPPAPREIARSFAAWVQLWQPLVRYSDPRFHLRIATGPDWEAWLLTWLPGQRTGLHDHGGSAGAFAVLAGSVDEDLLLPSPVVGRPRPPAAGGPDPEHRGRLLSRRYRAGQVRAFGTQHLHDVVARSGRRAVTLHVYAPRLTAMTRYALEDGRLVVTSREREGADW